MENILLSKKVKHLRKSKGLSQEALASIAGLSLRTIQRIENENKNASGDTIKRLSAALEVSPDFLMDWQPNENPNFLLILSFSSILCLINPFLAVLVPLILWLVKKNRIRGVKQFGVRILKVQVVWLVFFFVFRTLNFIRVNNQMQISKPLQEEEWNMLLSSVETQGYLKMGFTILNVIITLFMTYKTYLYNQSSYQNFKILNK